MIDADQGVAALRSLRPTRIGRMNMVDSATRTGGKARSLTKLSDLNVYVIRPLAIAVDRETIPAINCSASVAVTVDVARNRSMTTAHSVVRSKEHVRRGAMIAARPILKPTISDTSHGLIGKPRLT